LGSERNRGRLDERRIRGKLFQKFPNHLVAYVIVAQLLELLANGVH
jgi:hypothetical protein|tara:strand:+ start:1176 stop:1313 length:138 start_codon:yes stop_codon:yes gene_type:complete